MTEKKSVPLGPTGEAVAANVKRLRGQTTYKELSHRLSVYGRRIPELGLRRIEAGERRVDSDDLVALAKALDVSPVTLLMPHVPRHDQTVHLSGTPQGITALELWAWLRADYRPWSGDDPDSGDWFQYRATPPWASAAAQESLGIDTEHEARHGVD